MEPKRGLWTGSNVQRKIEFQLSYAYFSFSCFYSQSPLRPRRLPPSTGATP